MFGASSINETLYVDIIEQWPLGLGFSFYNLTLAVTFTQSSIETSYSVCIFH